MRMCPAGKSLVHLDHPVLCVVPPSQLTSCTLPLPCAGSNTCLPCQAGSYNEGTGQGICLEW